MRARFAALLLAVLASGAPLGTAWAQGTAPADTSSPFEVIPRAVTPHHSHKWSWITAIAGAALVGVSFPLADEADRRYDVYLRETDVARLDERFHATQRMDRLASGALLTGEGLLASAVWLRFMRGDHRVALDVRTDRCTVAVSF